MTDSIFSMEGTIAKAESLWQLAGEFDAMLIVDEAHATGVAGERGEGVFRGQESKNIVFVGTLSKALAAQGGFIAGPEWVIDRVVNGGRSFLYSTALAPACAAAALAALDVVRDAPERRIHLHELVTTLRDGLNDQGWTTVGEPGAPLVSVILETPDRVMLAARRLEDLGICAPPIRPSTVRRGSCRLRLSPMATHGADTMVTVLEAFSQIRCMQEAAS